MFVCKIKKGINQQIKVSEANFIDATKRKEPFYQTVNGEKRHYAYCPACENPVQLVHVHVDNQVVDENKRFVSMHARHIKKDIDGLGKYDQSSYDSCPYANPSSSVSKVRREQGAASDDLLFLIKNFPDVLDIVMRRDVGIAPSEELFEKMLTNFKEEKGHLYRYVSRFNLPYSFMYMSDSQKLLFEKVDINYRAGRELKDLINNGSRWCNASLYGKIYKNKEETGYIDLSFHFTDFDVDEIDGEKYQKFSLVIVESNNGVENIVLTKEIMFDQYYYLNTIEKRMRYMRITKNVYGQ
jgi:hypothetical protein